MTKDEARRIANGIVRPPGLVGARAKPEKGGGNDTGDGGRCRRSDKGRNATRAIGGSDHQEGREAAAIAFTEG